MPAGLVSPEASLLSLQTAAFSLGPHMTFLFARALLVSLFLQRHPSYWIGAPPLGPHLALITSLKALSPNSHIEH